MPSRFAFRNLWLATTVSQVGTQISELAIPLIAIVTLHATPFQVGLLLAVEFLPIIVFSLLAGAWVDRLRRRPLLIAGDLGRAVILLSIPAAHALGVLSLIQLYVAGFLVGSLSVVFDVAYQSYLPSVVDREQLVAANSKLQVSEQGASVVGPALGGSLISLVTAPLAVAFDAISYLASGVLLLSIRQPEPAPSGAAPANSGGVLGEIAQGIRYVVRHPVLRALVMVSGLIQFFGRIVMAVLLVYLVRDVGLSAAAIGTVFAIGGLGFVVGALLASVVSARLGLGRTLTVAAVLASLSPLLYAAGPRNLAGAFVAAGFFLYGVSAVTWSINSLSLRQAVAPPAMLGRVAATMRLFSWGLIPIGSLVGGLLGSGIGLHWTIVVGALGGLLASLPVLLSPVRRLKRISDDALTQPGIA
jgi:MFS family permease